ncbi:MAG: hypothetical protein PHN72_02150 [Bacilli bacterium]|nr:hypothetical protein [Bacilli bacterium]
MKEEIKRNVVKEICSDFVDTIIVGMEEYEKDFPYSLAVINFILELREKGINVNTNMFIDVIWDNMYKEFTNYLGR